MFRKPSLRPQTVRRASSSRAPQLGGHWSRVQAEALLFSGGAGPLRDGVSVGGRTAPRRWGGGASSHPGLQASGPWCGGKVLDAGALVVEGEWV